MDKEQRAFLETKLQKAIADQPQLEELSSLLLSLGGAFLVAPNKIDTDVPALITQGFVMSGPITVRQMESNRCHGNVVELWNRGEFIGIATGYALSKDKLWRQHSWGLLRNGILETTEKRIRYFGILLQGEKAHAFAEAN